MGNACQPFGYSIDDGMKAFCVAELCVGIFHLIMTSVAYGIFYNINEGHYYPRRQDGSKFWPGLIMVLYIILVVSLIVQFVMGFLMYFIGYKKRNMTICLVWIIVACVNFTIPWIVLACGAIYCGSGQDRICFVTGTFWTPCWLYLLYLILGVWIVVVYMKWAKSTGVAVQYSVTPAGGAGQSQSHRSAKVSNQDNEA